MLFNDTLRAASQKTNSCKQVTLQVNNNTNEENTCDTPAALPITQSCRGKPRSGAEETQSGCFCSDRLR